MRLDSFVLSFLILTAFIVGGVVFIGDINNNYANQGINISTDKFGAVFNTTDQMVSLSDDIKNDTFGGQTDETDTISSMFKGAYSALRAIRLTFTLFGDIANAIANELPIHPIFVVLAMAGLVIAVVFAIVYLIFRVVT